MGSQIGVHFFGAHFDFEVAAEALPTLPLSGTNFEVAAEALPTLPLSGTNRTFLPPEALETIAAGIYVQEGTENKKDSET